MPIYLATERVNVGQAAPHWLPIGCDLRDVFWRDRRWLWLHQPGQSPTEALVWFREPQSDPRLVLLADDPTETISKTAGDWLAERCADGRPLDPAKTFAELLLDILISPPANGSFGRPLVSDKRDQQYKLWLGPRDAGPVATKLDPVVRTASIAWADNFNRSGNLGGSGVSAGAASWVALDQDQSPAWQTDGAQVRSGQVGNGCYDRYSARLDTDTDSDDQYAQADMTWVSAGVNKNVGGVVVRMAGAYGNEGYSAEIGNEAGTEIWALKFWTDGSGLDSGTNSGSPKTLYLEFNGSNWDLKINGSSASWMVTARWTSSA